MRCLRSTTTRLRGRAKPRNILRRFKTTQPVLPVPASMLSLFGCQAKETSGARHRGRAMPRNFLSHIPMVSSHRLCHVVLCCTLLCSACNALSTLVCVCVLVWYSSAIHFMLSPVISRSLVSGALPGGRVQGQAGQGGGHKQLAEEVPPQGNVSTAAEHVREWGRAEGLGFRVFACPCCHQAVEVCSRGHLPGAAGHLRAKAAGEHGGRGDMIEIWRTLRA